MNVIVSESENRLKQYFLLIYINLLIRLLVDRKLWSSSHNLLFIFVFVTGRQMIRADCPYYTVSLRTLDSAKSKLNTHRVSYR